MTSFLNFQLPEDIERGVIGGPMFKTTVFPLESGFEQRNIDWIAPKGEWDAGYGLLRKFNDGLPVDADIDLLLRIFYNMQGKAFSFMFKDFSDFEIAYKNAVAQTPQTIALGDDATTIFQVFKQYDITLLDATTQSYQRPLTKLSDDAQFEVYLDGVLQIGGGVDYTADFLRGTLAFVTAPASFGGTGPSGEQVVAIRCNFLNHVRFNTDKIDVNMELFNAGSWPSFPLMEDRANGLDPL